MAVARTRERRRAFQVLYSLFFTEISSPAELKERFDSSPWDDDEAPGKRSEEAIAFAWDMVSGVWGRQDELDGLIREAAHRGLDRLGRVELVILRMGAYELLTNRSTDPKVIMYEAVGLTNEFADKTARHFIYATLEGMAKKLRQS